MVQGKVQQGIELTFSKWVLKDTCDSGVTQPCSATKAVSGCQRVLRVHGRKSGAVHIERRREGMGYSEGERSE